MRKSTLVQAAIFCAILPMDVSAVLYWDLNGTDPGAGLTPTGTWDTVATNWNASLDGTGTLSAWVAGDSAVLSAGNDATGSYTVTVNAAQTAAAITIEEGSVTIGGSQGVNIGTGTVTVSAAASLITNSSLRIPIAVGGSYILNGGTLQTTNPGNAGSFVDIDATISLGALGGTIVYDITTPTPTNPPLSIIQTNVVISGTGSLTKSGAGVIGIASASTYGGATIVNNGELRIRGAANRIPVATPVTVTGAGILNLNGLDQQIGSLSGDGSVGLGVGRLTVGNATDTVFSGVIADLKSIGGGVTSGNGKLTKVGTGMLTLSGINTYTGDFTLTSGTVTVTPSGTLAGSTSDVVVNGGLLNLNNAAQTVENLNGSGGTINLGSGHSLTVNPVATSTYNGIITGAGSLTKGSTFTEVLGGANTYLGTTTVSAGVLEISGSLNGTSQVQVGGTLAGSGNIIPGIGGDIDLLLGGKLSPGSTAVPAASTGTLTIALSGSGSVDLTAGIAAANSQALVFDLGTTSDKFSISGGALNIGTGVLEFDDFAFTTQAGFGIGDYVLFDGALPITGTLGAILTGTVGGLTGEIQIAGGGTDIVLHVIPEPSAAAALLGGIATLLGLRRRRC
jgi:fibronectin-binding autotransporter adhesin